MQHATAVIVLCDVQNFCLSHASARQGFSFQLGVKQHFHHLYIIEIGETYLQNYRSTCLISLSKVKLQPQPKHIILYHHHHIFEFHLASIIAFHHVAENHLTMKNDP